MRGRPPPVPTHVGNLSRQLRIGQFDQHVWSLWDDFRVRNHDTASAVELGAHLHQGRYVDHVNLERERAVRAGWTLCEIVVRYYGALQEQNAVTLQGADPATPVRLAFDRALPPDADIGPSAAQPLRDGRHEGVQFRRVVEAGQHDPVVGVDVVVHQDVPERRRRGGPGDPSLPPRRCAGRRRHTARSR